MNHPIRLNSRQSIIEAAFIVFSGNIGASLSEVAERAGVGRATLHRHFANREDLLRTLAYSAIEEMDAAAEAATSESKTYSDGLEQTLYALIPLGDRHGFLAREPLESDPGLAEEFSRMDREMLELVEASKKEGLFDANIPSAWINQMITALLFTAWETIKLGEVTNDQAAELAWTTLTKGLGANKK